MQTGLLERADELERIDAVLALAQADSGDILLITGPAGIGKSILLGVAGERAHLAGMQTSWALPRRCWPIQRRSSTCASRWSSQATRCSGPLSHPTWRSCW